MTGMEILILEIIKTFTKFKYPPVQVSSRYLHAYGIAY